MVVCEAGSMWSVRVVVNATAPQTSKTPPPAKAHCQGFLIRLNGSAKVDMNVSPAERTRAEPCLAGHFRGFFSLVTFPKCMSALYGSRLPPSAGHSAGYSMSPAGLTSPTLRPGINICRADHLYARQTARPETSRAIRQRRNTPAISASRGRWDRRCARSWPSIFALWR